jgi:hypothetical protein
MNITSKSGSTISTTDATLNDGRHESSDEAIGRRRWVAPIVAVTGTAVGTAALAAGVALPGIVGGMDLGNHNETLLSPAVDVEPPERRNRSRRRGAVSALVVTASLALGAAAFGVDQRAAGDQVALIGQCGNSSGGDNEGPRGCRPSRPVPTSGCPCPGNYGSSSGGGGV